MIKFGGKSFDRMLALGFASMLATAGLVAATAIWAFLPSFVHPATMPVSAVAFFVAGLGIVRWYQ